MIVQMNSAVKAQVAALPYVRAVAPMHPAYKLESYLMANFAHAQELFPLQVYHIMVFERGATQQTAVAERITALGGTAGSVNNDNHFLQARLTPTQLMAVSHWDEVCYIDRWFPHELLMDNVRDNEVSGVVYVETVAGFRGEGVRGEVMDNWLDIANTPPPPPPLVQSPHPGYQAIPPIAHGPKYTTAYDGQISHGTNVFGCLFWDGTGAGVPDGAKGIIPMAQGIFADPCRLTVNGQFGCDSEPIPKVTRHQHTKELVDNSPPDDIYKAVFQSISWTSGHVNEYGIPTAELDDAVFTFDLLTCQGQGNGGSTSAREGLAKNVVSVGGVDHANNDDRSDDQPTIGSYGPTPDGRIKPDLVHFLDNVYTTHRPNQYTDSFVGVSAATPITCGMFGLFFQMWAKGVFGNPLVRICEPATDADCVFDNRPHATTAKAMMINSARLYRWYNVLGLPEVTEENEKLKRNKQGWGLPSAGKLYASRMNFLKIVNETTALLPFDIAVHNVTVPENALALKVTLVYADPMGTPSSLRHVWNDLDLRVYSLGTTTYYYGNHGLRLDTDTNWSTPGGDWDEPKIDNVENVFIQNPPPGCFVIQVFADEINPLKDGHLETPGVVDAVYALVVSVEFDCDGNQNADSEDILDTPDTHPDLDNNGIPDQCSPGMVQAEGCRYIAITPPAGAATIALPVATASSSSANECLPQFVQADGDIAAVPVYQTPAHWGTVHVAGPALHPNAGYNSWRLISTDCGGTPSQSHASTATLWKWGDVNNTGVVDSDDILCVFDAFSGCLDDCGACGWGPPSPCPCSLYAYDLMPCAPDRLLDVDDVLAVLDAFAGVPFSDFCPDPCP